MRDRYSGHPDPSSCVMAAISWRPGIGLRAWPSTRPVKRWSCAMFDSSNRFEGGNGTCSCSILNTQCSVPSVVRLRYQKLQLCQTVFCLTPRTFALSLSLSNTPVPKFTYTLPLSTRPTIRTAWCATFCRSASSLSIHYERVAEGRP